MNRIAALPGAVLGGLLLVSPQTAPADPAKPPSPTSEAKSHRYPSIGNIEVYHPDLQKLIPAGARIELLAEGFEWAEGPVWNKRDKYLLFSDIPNNVVFKWQPEKGTTVFMEPSGYTGSAKRGGEPGSNGLVMDPQGRLILCQHGDRQIARLEKNRSLTVLARYYNWRRFNSPNDAVLKSNGDLYFTDPPYGLEGGNQSPYKELLFNGIYRLSPQGKVTLLTKEMSAPNGIAFSPDEKTLYVANSDPQRAVLMAYEVKADGLLGPARVFFDATHMVGSRKGLPDGLKVDQQGNLFATTPGGVAVFNPEGNHLGTINTGQATANCGWGGDGSVLYITADMYLCRIQTSTKGLGF